MQVLRTVFLGRLTSHFRYITWLAHSPDPAVPDYFPWGYVKSKVQETHPANTAPFKRRILRHIPGILKEMLHVMTAFTSRLQECTEQHGGHLQNVILEQ